MARPREFDLDAVTEAAMQLFWTQGFQATSLSDLVEATKLNRSSLYNAFGDKEGILQAAVARYRAGPGARVLIPLKELSGLPAMEGFFTELSGFLEGIIGRGCLVFKVALESAGLRPRSRAQLAGHFADAYAGLVAAYETAKTRGDLAVSWPATEAVDWLMNAVRGSLSGAAAGEPAGTLQRSLERTLAVVRQARSRTRGSVVPWHTFGSDWESSRSSWGCLATRRRRRAR